MPPPFQLTTGELTHHHDDETGKENRGADQRPQRPDIGSLIITPKTSCQHSAKATTS
ncbi:hypothetical protein [Streptomyces sp. DT195]|uniref:hypothetical protein n=1 Tax=Streptomyces sp. DT195 TaxID=3393419 RepID=UPI003CEB798A